MKDYTHFSIEERESLLELKAQGLSNRQIAKILNKSHTTIGRELKRNTIDGKYRPSKAKELYEDRRNQTGIQPILESNFEVRNYIEAKLREDWTPDQISQRAKLEGFCNISTATIYRGINSGIIDVDKEKHLKFKGKRRAKNSEDNRGKIPDRVFIDERPKEANERSEKGHWEADLVISKGRKGGVLTIVDRYSRFPIVVKIENKRSSTIIDAFKIAFEGVPEEYIKTITVDNGKEFAGFKEIAENHNADVYFCNPYSPWEKGSNENFNGLLRRYYPKGTNFAEISDLELQEKVEKIKNRPRKILGYMTADEVFKGKIEWCA